VITNTYSGTTQPWSGFN